MLTSLALLFLTGLAAAEICKRVHLPRIIGMLIVGIGLGPYALGILDPSLLGISAQLRKMALIIILIKAGLALNVRDLKAVGRPAILMSFLPAAMEIAAFMAFAPALLGVSGIEAAIMGSVLGAVSPAVVVPKMVQLMEEKRGTGKRVPQMILAGASLDDVFVIVLFTTFCGIAQGERISPLTLAEVPVSILTGIGGGIVAGLILHLFLEGCHRAGHTIRNSAKVILLLSAAFLLESAEALPVPFSGLLAVMGMACTLQMKSDTGVIQRLSAKFGKLWIAAEVMLFVLVGAAVDIRFTMEAGAMAAAMILLALVFRSIGTWLSLLGTPLNAKERLFCVIAYLPKATVQAAIGGVPLALGLPCGKAVLSIAVLSILITAPLGAFGMELTDKRLLTLAK